MPTSAVPSAKRRFRFLQFSLRDLLLLILLLGVLLGILVARVGRHGARDEERRARQDRAAGAIIRNRGAVEYDAQASYAGYRDGGPLVIREARFAPGAAWEEVRHVADLLECRRLMLRGAALTDADVENVAKAKLKSLAFLDLTATAITDHGVLELRPLRELEHLSLDHTALTDDALESLRGMPRLRRLSVRGTHVTEHGAASFEQARPDVKLSWATAPSAARRRDAAALERWGFRVEARRNMALATEYVVAIDALRLDDSFRYPPSASRISPSQMREGLKLVADFDPTGLILSLRREHLAKEVYPALANFARLRELTLQGWMGLDLAPLADLRNLRSLALEGCMLSDSVVERVNALSELEELTLENPDAYLSWDGQKYDGLRRFNDKGLARIASLRNLRRLALRDMAASEAHLARAAELGQSAADVQITDAGLEHLTALGSLETLDLSGSPVTAEGLRTLRGLKKLRELIVADIPFRPEQKRELQEAFPRTTIAFERTKAGQAQAIDER